jgi:outer membrane receptor protein involved in Fe transport
MPRTPEWVLNGAVGWENRHVSVRLAVTYRDIALLGTEDLEDADFDIFQDEHTQVDLSAKWNITNQWQLAFAATNLTDEPFYSYFGNRSYNSQFEEYGRTYSLGIKYTPFQ